MKHDLKKYLLDILQAINIIEDRIYGMKYENYAQDLTIKDSVERRFLIIGEAMNHIVRQDPDVRISATIEIIGMRNHIVHGYDCIADSIVWNAITKHLPILKQEVQCLLDNSQSIE
jgi:uncharacterized protein with HEPN domain